MIEQSGTGVLPKRIELAYDAAGQLTSLARFEGLADPQRVADTTYVYDAAGRLTELLHAAPDGSTLAKYNYTYDAASRTTRFVSQTDGAADFSYDPTGQLTAADYDYQADQSLSYDLNGNRTIEGYVTGPNNQTTATVKGQLLLRG